MQSTQVLPNNELMIYPTYIRNDLLAKFSFEMKFRELDRTDIPGVALKGFNICVGLIAGMKLYNPIFNQSFGTNVTYLNIAVKSAQELSNRGKVFISNNFPQIPHHNITASVADFIYMGENNLIPHKDNPYYKDGLTHIPTMKNNWSIVYIVSLCSESELLEKGLNHGFLTKTKNDAVQLAELICDRKFPAPYNFQETQQFVDRLLDASYSDSEDDSDLENTDSSQESPLRNCNDTLFASPKQGDKKETVINEESKKYKF